METANALPDVPDLLDAPVRLLVGPVNSAGQGYAWARAAERHTPGVAARNLALTNRFQFPADYSVDPATYVTAEWGRAQERYVLGGFTHVLAESGRPVMGLLNGRYPEPELALFADAGISVALLSHGSDTRVPHRHAQRERWSPFRDPTWDEVEVLEAGARRLSALFNDFDGPTFVSTPDLLEDLPAATWCPVVVDVDTWATQATPLERDRPVVVHVPSHSRLKGSGHIVPVLERLHDAGLIDYQPREGVSAAAMVAVYGGADIVVDQMTMGIYGVAACEAMAAGRVVVSQVAERVRARVKSVTGHDLPIVHAEPDTLEQVLVDVVTDRNSALTVARRGVDFVSAVHDGRASAAALAPFLVGAEPAR